MEVKTTSKYQTQKIGENFAKTLKGGELVAFYGNLGAGKTAFIQGLAKGLGIKNRVLSPTFVLIRSYKIPNSKNIKMFHHIDLYRLNKESFQNQELEEMISPEDIIAVEWAEKLQDILKRKRIDVLIDSLNQNERRIKITKVNN